MDNENIPENNEDFPIEPPIQFQDIIPPPPAFQDPPAFFQVFLRIEVWGVVFSLQFWFWFWF